jgi:hypothetical protein
MNMREGQTENGPAAAADHFLNPKVTTGFITARPSAPGSANQVEPHRNYFLAPAAAAFKAVRLDGLRARLEIVLLKASYRLAFLRHCRAKRDSRVEFCGLTLDPRFRGATILL